jgi:plasmid stability protein
MGAPASLLTWTGETHGQHSITIRNLDDDLKRRLRVREAENGRSMEEEVRKILCHAVSTPSAPRHLGQSIHARFAALGGVDPIPAVRTLMRTSQDDD